MKHIILTLYVLFGAVNLVFFEQIITAIPIADKDMRSVFYWSACLAVNTGFIWLLVERKKKFTACCSLSVLNDVNQLGFSSPFITCPMPSDVNYSKLMANPKEYQFVILDANAASGFKVDDIEHAIIQSKTANVVIRFDESTYAGRDISWMQMAFRQAGVPVYSTLQLFNLLTKYYGKN